MGIPPLSADTAERVQRVLALLAALAFFHVYRRSV